MNYNCERRRQDKSCSSNPDMDLANKFFLWSKGVMKGVEETKLGAGSTTDTKRRTALFSIDDLPLTLGCKILLPAPLKGSSSLKLKSSTQKANAQFIVTDRMVD